MKRIAILSLVFNNYGTRLQSYALCRVINSLYKDKIDICVINIDTPWKSVLSSLGFRNVLLKTIKSYGLRKAIPCVYNMFRWKIDMRDISKDFSKELFYKRNKLFNHFNNNIPYSKIKYEAEDIRKGALNEYDGFIVGSDQVWNSIKVPLLDIFMLDFVKNKSKCLTYAASFGMTEIPAEDYIEFQKGINNFSSLLIREREGIELCKQLGRNDAEIVLDPTLLLDKKDYSDIISLDEDYDKINGKYILVYSLNQSYKIYDETYKMCKSYNYKMVILKRSMCPPKTSKYKDAIELYAVSPGNFLRLIKDAECVVTNSYHALLFSINLNSKFYLFLNNADEENSRLLTIVHNFDLEDRVFWETHNLPQKIKEIDYVKINEKLKKERLRSISLLKSSIENYILKS